MEDRCDALYCREPAVVGVRLSRDLIDRTTVSLCAKHWDEHCADKIVHLTLGRNLLPIPRLLVRETAKGQLTLEAVSR